MSPTPLRLEHYFFTRIHSEANPEFVTSERDESQRPDVDVGAKIDVFKHEADPHRYQLTLTVDKVVGTEGAMPYKLDIQVVGLFVTDPEFKHDNIDRLVHVNGASMLYTAAREFVLMITGRGPWGPFQLPTVNFHWALAEHEEKQTKDPKKSRKDK